MRAVARGANLSLIPHPPAGPPAGPRRRPGRSRAGRPSRAASGPAAASPPRPRPGSRDARRAPPHGSPRATPPARYSDIPATPPAAASGSLPVPLPDRRSHRPFPAHSAAGCPHTACRGDWRRRGGRADGSSFPGWAWDRVIPTPPPTLLAACGTRLRLLNGSRSCLVPGRHSPYASRPAAAPRRPRSPGGATARPAGRTFGCDHSGPRLQGAWMPLPP